MAVGSVANAAYAHEKLEPGVLPRGPLIRLVLVLLAERACSGAAVVSTSELCMVCGADDPAEIDAAIASLVTNDVLEGRHHFPGWWLVWLPIAASDEIDRAVEVLAESGHSWVRGY